MDVPYYVEEEYTDIEEVEKTLSYVIQDNSIYHNRIGGLEGLFGIGEQLPQYFVYATVTNTSLHGGVFQLYATVTSQGSVVNFLTDMYIPAGQTRELRQTKDINHHSFKAEVDITTWGIRPPTVTVEEEVTKTRQIVKYRLCNTCKEDCEALAAHLD